MIDPCAVPPAPYLARHTRGGCTENATPPGIARTRRHTVRQAQQNAARDRRKQHTRKHHVTPPPYSYQTPPGTAPEHATAYSYKTRSQQLPQHAAIDRRKRSRRTACKRSPKNAGPITPDSVLGSAAKNDKTPDQNKKTALPYI